MTDQPAAIDLLGDARRSLLAAIKLAGRATIPQLAERLSISTEAVRQQLSYLQREGWVLSDCGPDGGENDGRMPGRPPAEYCLSLRADDLFPKQYAALLVAFFDQLADPERTLAALTDERVASLGPSLSDAPRRRRMERLRSIYRDGDPYTDVQRSDRGFSLIERNCPYLQFATERPLFCSTTVSALRRLTGSEVVREERFQDGDGRCVFHVYGDVPTAERRRSVRFEREPAKDFRPKGA